MSSDQLELLLAFEDSEGLGRVAEMMGRDPSVVSRGLQRIAEDFPVLLKVRGRWEITPLGKQTNELTRKFLNEQKALFSSVERSPVQRKVVLTLNTALVVINAQQGLLDATQPGRNNSEAEANILSLLKTWRSKKIPVIHVKHLSDNPGSIFYRGSTGCAFLSELSPLKGEEIVEKSKSSGFAGTSLESVLKKIDVTKVVLVGFTANECIDATARDASTLGFSTYVVGDATAMFDMHSPDGKLLKAERLHRLTLANIAAFYATVIVSKDLK